MCGGQQLLWAAEDAQDRIRHYGHAVSLRAERREAACVQLLMATGGATASALHPGDGVGGNGKEG